MRILIVLFLFIASFASAQSTVKNVDAAEFKKLAATGKYIMIDLRTTEEITRHGAIPGSIQIDYLGKDSEKKIEELDKKKSYLVYCAGGGRSSDCAATMVNTGFKEVINLEKGFDDWKRKGFEVQKSKH